MTSIRLPVSFFLSSITTVALFWFLGMLTAARAPIETVITVPNISIGRVIEDTPLETKKRAKPIPKPPPPERSQTPFRDAKAVEPNLGDSAKLAPEFTGPGDLIRPEGGGPEIAHRSGSDRGPVAQIRIEPDYPPQARDRGVEGWVKFSHTVTSSGSVKDVVILESQPPRIWDGTTIRAVSAWKYQPALRDGRPVEQVGLVAIYRFELD